MSNRSGWQVLSVLLVAACSAVWGADEKLDRWDLRDVWKLTFEGNDTYNAPDIRHALALDGVVQVTVDPNQPLEDFHKAVLQRVAYGYRSAGFADVKTSARVDNPDRPMTVVIKEGARYKCGEIRVLGDAAVDRSVLTRQIKGLLPTDDEEQQTGQHAEDDDDKAPKWSTQRLSAESG